MNTAKIEIASPGLTVRFAARELSRYLSRATTAAGWRVSERAAKNNRVLFYVGVCDDLGISPPKGSQADDDWICIRPKGDGYVITGSNPRSVLFAVYRYLHRCGFRWLRPGARGEVIPTLSNPIVKGIRVAESASYRYRTVCIEGAVSERHVRDIIDWQAKHAMNGYFLQFHLGTDFFRRWSVNPSNPYRTPRPLSQQQVQESVRKIVADIQKRGMRFERMGHGWTCAALGIPGEGWQKTGTDIVPADKVDWLAQINGKKELFKGVALNTNLNYSNPKVRHAVVDPVVVYAREHPEVQLLHFWLGDGDNNYDERAASAAARPSDFYVDMLNELDAKLAAAGLDTRIVFLVYVDLLWPPTRSRIRNPNRFVLMFAPITRSYLQSFADAPATDERPTRYVRNKLKMPKSAAVNLHYLRQWQRQFRGDGFDFDYHLLWACYADPSMFNIARTLHRDIQNLQKMGLHGLNSCQAQRMSYPHNLPMEVMAQTLWNRKTPFARIVRASFRDAFGAEGTRVAAAFKQIAKLWRPMLEGVHTPGLHNRIVQGLANLPGLAEQVVILKELVDRNLPVTQGAVRWSWRYLDHYVSAMNLLLPAFKAYLNGSSDIEAKMMAAIHYLYRREPLTHPVLDTATMDSVLRHRITEVDKWRQAEPWLPHFNVRQNMWHNISISNDLREMKNRILVRTV